MEDRSFTEGLGRISPGARRDLLRVVSADSRVRADVIRQFHERPGGHDMAEFLMDLEMDELLRWRLIEVLERISGD